MENKKYDEKFIKSLKNLELKKNARNKYSFQAEIVIPFKNFLINNNNKLSYTHLVSLFLSLRRQIELLKNENIGILYFDLNSILVVKNDTYYDFYYMNTNMLFEVSNNILKIDKVFNKNEKINETFLSPELIIINKIPSVSYFTCCYFSLAILVAFCINGNNLDYFKTHDWCEDDLKKIMEPIHSTKLFYALERASNLEPEKRYLLWI